MPISSQLAAKEIAKEAKKREKENKLKALKESMMTVVLDCVAERKTSADLASSIVDGRYNEQKQR
jgi:23S rRNA pseudoU1915 N3-methylase RlmH